MKLCGVIGRNSLVLAALLSIPSCIGAEEGAHKQFDINNAVGKENLVDMLVLGSGPAGLNAAIHGARSRLNTLVLEGNAPGGQLMRTHEVENFPGFDMITGPELIDKIRKQTEKFGAEFLSDSLEGIDFSSWPYKVTTENGEVIHAMTVVVTTGSSPRKVGVPGEEEYYGRGVSHCAICDGRFFAGKHVVVVGGGDSAVEEAIQLINFGVDKVTVLVRGDKMRAVKCLQDRLKEENKVFIKHNTQIKEIIGNGEDITGVKVLDKVAGKHYVIPASAVFLAIGSEPNTWFLKEKVDLDDRGYIVMQERTQRTSQKAVYAAGDVESGRVKQIVIASGIGRQAGIEAVKFLTEEIGLNRKIIAKLGNEYYKGTNRDQDDKKPELALEGEVRVIETQEQFAKQVLEEKEKLVLVDFYTDTCSSCKQMLPALQELAKDYAKKIHVFKIDAMGEYIEAVRAQYKIAQVPRVMLFKNGVLIEDRREALSRAELSAVVDAHLR